MRRPTHEESAARPRAIVVMGVSGSGKTTIGKALAAAIGARFVDADDLHPAANRAKMANGEPLTDEDRWPWLDAVAEVLARASAEGESLVVACSALKAAYRERLAREATPSFVFLDVPEHVLRERLASRKGHFFAPELLASQLETLERPEGALIVDAAGPVDEVTRTVARSIASGGR